MNNLSFAQTFKELVMIQQMARIFEKLNGTFSGKVAVDAELDHTMSPILSTLTASGSLNTRDLNLSGVDVIDKIADATNRDEIKNLSVKDLNVDFAIQDGRVSTRPFDLKMGNATLSLSGTTGLDQTIDYTGRLKLPATAMGISTIDLTIGGRYSSPKISIDAQSMAKQAANTVTEKAVEAVSDKIGIDLSADKRKEERMKVAREAAERLVEEAEKQKANLMQKAGNNAIKKLAAEKAGDILITEARKKGEQLISEAENK
jgi:hypothetical protein